MTMTPARSIDAAREPAVSSRGIPDRTPHVAAEPCPGNPTVRATAARSATDGSTRKDVGLRARPRRTTRATSADTSGASHHDLGCTSWVHLLQLRRGIESAGSGHRNPTVAGEGL